MLKAGQVAYLSALKLADRYYLSSLRWALEALNVTVFETVLPLQIPLIESETQAKYIGRESLIFIIRVALFELVVNRHR